MIGGWIRNVLGTLLPQTIGQGGAAQEKKAKPRLEVGEGPALDPEEAREKSGELLAMFRKTGEKLDSIRLRMKARQLVKQNLVKPFSDMDNVVDEVTEKLVQNAQMDPRFKKWFA